MTQRESVVRRTGRIPEKPRRYGCRDGRMDRLDVARGVEQDAALRVGSGKEEFGEHQYSRGCVDIKIKEFDRRIHKETTKYWRTFEALANILQNASRYTPENGTIKLSVTPRRDMIAVTIADNGPGVAAADLKRILEPFEHAGRAQDHASGAGLGLTLVNAFAELHDGSLELDSAIGKGFRATLLLPKAS